ncbi:hypothetical protein [Streptomyces sp. MUSC 14]|uniref:hypothetical protein n=1 Tax=Streptomyces sp. MUSC 14 TaxID=1354889 RepID=UPI00210C9E2C|nr:hypothetical protein [Streptomyces sp. MUSC 14]
MVWYVPPLSPVVDALTRSGHDGERPAALFGAIDALRIPLGYLAGLFTAGDTAPVEAALCRLAAMRAHMRRVNLGEERDPSIAHGVGMTESGLEAMYRLLALAKYEERYVVPTTYVAGAGEGGAAGAGCSLEGSGGPGMFEAEAFHGALVPTAAGSRGGGTDGGGGGALRGRVNLLNWNGRGRPRGLFPDRGGEAR